MHPINSTLPCRHAGLTLALVLAGGFTSAGLGAQTALVEDIRPGAAGSAPNGTAHLDGLLLFGADDGDTGEEPWVSDGTAAGTFRLKDIYGGATGSQPVQMTRFKQWVLFHARNAAKGRELWRTDGTRSGTSILKDIRPGVADGCGSVAAGGGCRQLTPAGEYLYFYANNGEVGSELWKTDGTGPGTTLVKDIYPGFGSSLVCGLTAYKGQVIFAATDGESGFELWRSDGTAKGTRLVRDIWEGPRSGLGLCESDPGLPEPVFTPFKGRLYFAADRPAEGIELWVTDGTRAGTKLVKDINPGATNSLPNLMTVWRDELFFAAGDAAHGYELWKSDGTAKGTVLVRDVYPGFEDGLVRPDGNTELIVANGELFFNATDGVHGRELWKTDGTEAGTIMVRDLTPGPNDSTPRGFEVSSDTLFFRASGPTGTELYRSNGSEVGTVLVKDIQPGEICSVPTWLTDVWGTLMFAADDGTDGDELWRSGEPVQPLDIEGVPSLNGNGLAEAAALVREFHQGDGHNIVVVKDGKGGGTISNAEFFNPTWRAQDLVVVDEGDRSRLGVLATRKNGRIAVEQRLARTGKPVGRIDYFSPKWRALRAAAIPGAAAEGIAVLAVGPTGQVAVETRDVRDGELVKRIEFFGAAAHPVTLAAVPDLNGNGISEVAVLARKKNGNSVVAIRDLEKKSLVSEIVLFGGLWRPVDMAVLESVNDNRSADVAVLAEKKNGSIAVEIRDGRSGKRLDRIIFLTNAWSPHQLRVLPDTNDNGAPEIAVLAVNPQGRIGAEVRDAATGERISRTKFLTTSFSPVGVAVLGDIAGSQAGELAVLAFRNEGGDLRLQARDGRNGKLVRTIKIP